MMLDSAVCAPIYVHYKRNWLVLNNINRRLRALSLYNCILLDFNESLLGKDMIYECLSLVITATTGPWAPMKLAQNILLLFMFPMVCDFRCCIPSKLETVTKVSFLFGGKIVQFHLDRSLSSF